MWFLLDKLILKFIFVRCGNIAGSYNLPIWNENDMILLILRGVILSKSAPDINWQACYFILLALRLCYSNLILNYRWNYHLLISSPTQ